MNPLEKYNSIVINRQKNPLDSSEYGEVHHIIPSSCGGGNAEWNLVKLTPEEHYRCHELLPFIYTKGKEHRAMVFAWHLIAHTREGAPISESEFSKLKHEFSMVDSKTNKGENHPNFGKHRSEDTKKKISEANKGHKPWNTGKKHSSETIRKMSEAKKGNSWNKGKPKSEEHRKHLSEALKGLKPWITGRKHSPETIKKMSEARKRYYENKRKEKVA